MSSHSRLHGNESVRVPWAIDEESVAVTKKFVELKKSLLSYLKELSTQVNEKGTPIMRPMFFEFPDQKTCWFLDQQYMFGPDLLVAPVFNETGEVEFYLPEGEWINYFNKEIVTGGRWIKETHDFMSLPLYQRKECEILK